MKKATTYSKLNTKTTDTILPKDVFEVEVNQDLLKQAMLRDLSNTRHAHAKTLTRGEVRGGGRKPWRQKGTGRARFGSSRVNIWRHGGVAHGPTGLENFHKAIPKNMFKRSISSAFSAKNENTIIIEKLDIPKPKTALANKLVAKINAEGNVLFICESISPKIELAFSNLSATEVITVSQLTVSTILCADTLVIEKPALKLITEKFGVKS